MSQGDSVSCRSIHVFLQKFCQCVSGHLPEQNEHITRQINYDFVKHGNYVSVGHASLSCMHVPFPIPFMHTKVKEVVLTAINYVSE